MRAVAGNGGCSWGADECRLKEKEKMKKGSEN